MDSVGIFDPDGLHNNPLTGESYSDNYKKLASMWRNFPAYAEAKNIVKAVKENQVLLIISGTGSGKTVLTPKLVLHTLDYKGKIITTLPKRLVAKSNAQFAAETLDVKLGEQVGYQYKGSPSNAKSDKTNLLYATDGSVVARLLNDPKLEGIDAVIIDEAHERKVQIDFLLYLLRDTLKLRPDFKLVIMSATVNSEIFSQYFVDYKFKEVNIGGKTNYPIESVFLDNSVEYDNAINKGFDILLKLLNNHEDNKDILFFVTSRNEAFDLCKKLDLHHKNNKQYDKHNVYCVEVFSGMDSNKEKLAVEKSEPNSRKVVFATNVAESSITIEGVKYVIDSGRELKSYYDPVRRANILEKQLITHAQAKQRMGRSGRTEPGVCYHLYTKEQFDKSMGRFPEPDIRVSDISGDCLRLLNLDRVNSVENLLQVLTHLIEPPREIYIRDALSTLIKLECIDDNKISEIGKVVSKLNPNPMIGLTLMYSKVYNCSFETVNIISVLDACKNNLSELFTINSAKKHARYDKDKLKQLDEKFKKEQKKYRDKSGDHISLLNIYTKFNEKSNPNSNKNSFIKTGTLYKAKSYARKLYIDLKKYDVPSTVQPLDSVLQLDVNNRILYCFSLGFKTNSSNLSKSKIRPDKMSFINLNKNVNSIFYTELFIMEGKASFNIVSKLPKNI